MMGRRGARVDYTRDLEVSAELYVRVEQFAFASGGLGCLIGYYVQVVDGHGCSVGVLAWVVVDGVLGGTTLLRMRNQPSLEC